MGLDVNPHGGRHLTAEMDLDGGTTAFMFLSTTLVQFMTPGLAFFYAGMVGSKSVVAVMYQSIASLGLIWCLWIFVVFSLTFGQPWITHAGTKFLGYPGTYFMLRGVNVYHPLQRAGAVVAPGFPGMLFMAFQGMFAVITPALISGAFVDRMRFLPYLVFIGIWLFLVYAPLGYWNWGGGWMFQYGAWDFAGGMVVHESAGFSALGALWALGPREQPFRDPFPHSITLVMIGTAFLWFGWFGFNGGSALAIGGLATIAFVNTQIAPAVGMVTWVLMDWTFNGKPTLMGASAGTVTGLVVITPSAGFVQPHFAMFAGVSGAMLCWTCACYIKFRTQLDDTCETVGVHGMGGFFGTILVGLISDPPECQNIKTAPVWCANPGTCARSVHQLTVQSVCAVAAAAYSLVMTYAILQVLQLCVRPLKTMHEQAATHDEHEFNEVAYRMEDFPNWDDAHSDEDSSAEAESSFVKELARGLRLDGM